MDLTKETSELDKLRKKLVDIIDEYVFLGVRCVSVLWYVVCVCRCKYLYTGVYTCVVCIFCVV